MDMLEFIRQLLRNMTREKNTLYVLCPAGIGDFLIFGGLCHALLKKKHKQNCVFIVQERFANSGLNFVGVREIRCLPQMLMEIIRHYSYATRDYETDNYLYGHFKMHTNFENWNAVDWDANLSFVDRCKKDALGLPLNTEIILPIIDELPDYQEQRLHKNYNLDKERTIILMPHANSLPNFEESFWEKLAAELIRKGYVLYTNVSNPREKVITGTAPIITTFLELLYIAEKVNCFIGLRSGIFDLLALTNARLLYVITGFRHWFFDLSVNYSNINSRAFYFGLADYFGMSDVSNMQTFMQQNNLSSIDDLVFNNCIKGSDVAFDLDSLLEKILSAVD